MPRLFGAKLRYLRELHSVTQSNLARQLEVSRGFMNNIEAGRKGPSLMLVLQIADRFGMTTEYLLQDSIPVANAPAPFSQKEEPALSYRLLGPKLRFLREARNVTQRDLVQRLGARSQSHVSLIETGRNEPSIEMVVQLAELFGVTTDYLLRDTIPVASSPDGSDI